MALIVNESREAIWRQAVVLAEKDCGSILSANLETYLVSLLQRYLVHTDLVNKIFAEDYLSACHAAPNERAWHLQLIGDECLLYTGLFPEQAQRRMLKLNYYIQMGQSAYHALSRAVNDLYALLSHNFVIIMDVLQTLSQQPTLLPLEAYERWQECGSQRAYRMLLQYGHGGGLPFNRR